MVTLIKEWHRCDQGKGPAGGPWAPVPIFPDSVRFTSFFLREMDARSPPDLEVTTLPRKPGKYDFSTNGLGWV